MPRAASEEPEGLVYEPELLSAEEEVRLLDRLESLGFDPIVLHGRAARRTGRHSASTTTMGRERPSPASRSRTGCCR